MRLKLLLLTLIAAQAATARPIIPQPAAYRHCDGKFTINDSTRITCPPELERLAVYLTDYLPLGIEPCDNTASGSIALRIDPAIAGEAYRLNVSEQSIVISAGTYAGAFNGVETLLQLLPETVYSQAVRPMEIGCCSIDDAPRYSYRGFMLDVCRTWIDKDKVKHYITILAHHKINKLHIHLSDDEAWRIEIKSHPELAEIGGFRGGDSPIWPRYGKWNERYGGYFTQEDMREIIEFAAIRNIEIIPEIDLPGHSLCLATMHPEVLCDYKPDLSASLGYDTRSALCATKESNYRLIEDILGELCDLFPSEYIHVGGDEVEMTQWKSCPSCRRFMQEQGMDDPHELEAYFMSRVEKMLRSKGKHAAVWNEAVNGGQLDAATHVYGWESIDACRKATAAGYSTVVMPGAYFYFDMKQSPREPGHDWAAIFDCRKVYSFSVDDAGFSPEQQSNISGFEATFFSEAYASRTPENTEYIEYQTFPRICALAEIAWSATPKDWDAFYDRLRRHYRRMTAMNIHFRLFPPVVTYADGVLTAEVDDNSTIYYRREPLDEYIRYTAPIATDSPAEYSFVSRYFTATSPEAGTEAHFKTITPSFVITSSMPESETFSFAKAQNYGRLARTARAADVGDWVQFTFDKPVACRRMKVATGNFQLPRFIFENGYVEISHDGSTFHRAGDLTAGAYTIEYPARPIKAVRITCTSRGNGAAFVSIQPPTIYPLLTK